MMVSTRKHIADDLAQLCLRHKRPDPVQAHSLGFNAPEFPVVRAHEVLRDATAKVLFHPLVKVARFRDAGELALRPRFEVPSQAVYFRSEGSALRCVWKG